MIEFTGIILQHLAGLAILWAWVWTWWDYNATEPGYLVGFGVVSLIAGLMMAPTI